MTLTADAVASAGHIDHLDTGTTRPWRRLPSVWSMLLAATVTIGLLLRLLPTLRGASLTGVREYDDGVHYGAGLALVHGRMPYRDFVLLHPPGVAILMAPFAALGGLIGEADAMAVARLAVLLIAATNILIVATLVRPHGRPAMHLAAGLYAVWPGTVIAERTVMLEPFLNLFCLLSALALRRRRPGTAGVAIAVAVCVKLFALSMLLGLVVAVVLGRAGRRRFGVGLATGLAAVAGPFLVVAPGAMWHDVVVVQLTRPAAGVAGVVARGAAALPVMSPMAAGVALTFVLVLGWSVAAARQPETRPWAVALGATMAGFVLGRSFYVHYSGYLAVPLALMVPAAIGGGRRSDRARAAVGGLLCCIVGAHVMSTTHQPPSASSLSHLPVGCVWSESPSLLVSLGRLSPPSAHCSQPVDPRGSVLAAATSLPRASFYPRGFRDVANGQRLIGQQLSKARLLLLSGPLSEDPLLDATNQALIRARFVPLLTDGGVTVWQRCDKAYCGAVSAHSRSRSPLMSSFQVDCCPVEASTSTAK